MRASKVIFLFALLSIIMCCRPIFAASSSSFSQVGIDNAPANWVGFYHNHERVTGDDATHIDRVEYSSNGKILNVNFELSAPVNRLFIAALAARFLISYISQSSLRVNETLSQYSKVQENNIKNNITYIPKVNFKLLYRVMEVSGIRVDSLEYNVDRTQVLQIFFISDNKLYTIGYKAGMQDFSRYLPIVSDIVYACPTTHPCDKN